MRVLVTGGAGYIGSVVVEQLRANGHDLEVLDDLSTGHPDSLAPSVPLREVSLLDRPGVASVLADGFDAVLHFAARSLVGESVSDPGLYHRNNVVGALNLLEAMVESGTQRLVVSSTAAVYGEPERSPIRESDPALPTNPYGSSKLAVDRMVAEFSAAHGLATTSLRYFNVAGASRGRSERHRVETHLVPLVLAAAAGLRPSVSVFGTDYPTPDGTAVRDYIHVEDLGRAHLLALDALVPGRHEVYNLGSGSGFSVREVLDVAREVTGSSFEVVEAPRRPGDPSVLVASSALIHDRLGWAPEKDLPAMVADAWELFPRS